MTFRLSVPEIEDLDRCADTLGLSRSDCIRYFIERGAAALKDQEVSQAS